MGKLWVVMLFAAGCVHHIPLAPVEQCGLQNMAVEGMTMTSFTTDEVATSGRYIAYGTASSYGQGVSCGRPQSKEEACSARAGRESASIKLDWSPGWRNALIFVGYYLFVVPGIVESVAFISEQDSVASDARHAYDMAFAQCMGNAPRIVPPLSGDPANVQPGPESGVGFCYVARRSDGQAEFRCSQTADECRSKFEHADGPFAECRQR